jgi:hypothetical protein
VLSTGSTCTAGALRRLHQVCDDNCRRLQKRDSESDQPCPTAKLQHTFTPKSTGVVILADFHVADEHERAGPDCTAAGKRCRGSAAGGTTATHTHSHSDPPVVLQHQLFSKRAARHALVGHHRRALAETVLTWCTVVAVVAVRFVVVINTQPAGV